MNIFTEAGILTDIYSEYLKLINYYYNTKRQTPLVKYYNLNMDISIVNENLNSSYDIYSNSGLYFDLLDFTPAYYLTPVLNISSSIPDLAGQMMDASTTIVVYTIKYPRISDIISFYSPIQKDKEIFRVVNVKTATSALSSTPSVHFYELDLEYAPMLTLESLKVNSRYIYDFSIEKYVPYQDFVQKTQVLENLKTKFQEIMTYYSPKLDMFIIENTVPIFPNQLVLEVKKIFDKKFRRIFNDLKSPFGYYFKYFIENYNLTEVNLNETFEIINLDSGEIETRFFTFFPEYISIYNVSNQILSIISELSREIY